MGMDLKGRQYDLQTMQPPVTLLTVGIPKNGECQIACITQLVR